MLPPGTQVAPPQGDLAQLGRLARFLTPYRWRIALALVALVVAANCVLALGQGLRYVIDAGLGSGDLHLLNMALAAVVAVATVLACATWVRFYFNLGRWQPEALARAAPVPPEAWPTRANLALTYHPVPDIA